MPDEYRSPLGTVIRPLRNIRVVRLSFRDRLRDEYRNCRRDLKMSVPVAAYYAWRLARTETLDEWLAIHGLKPQADAPAGSDGRPE